MSAREKYMFNIVTEAKVRTLAVMTKKYNPNWTPEQVEDYLKRLIEYAVEKELIEGK